MLLLNVPVPVPSMVFVFNSMVGLGLVLQHTPRAVTAELPSETTTPPATADELVMDVALAVLTLDKSRFVLVKVT